MILRGSHGGVGGVRGRRERGEDGVNAVLVCERLKTIKSKLKKERMLEYYI